MAKKTGACTEWNRRTTDVRSRPSALIGGVLHKNGITSSVEMIRFIIIDSILLSQHLGNALASKLVAPTPPGS